MQEIVNDPDLIAHCGLYCAACGAYLKSRCRGCRANVKATWCKIRTCCQENDRATCADCPDFTDPRECAKYHTMIARIIGFVLRSDRAKCIARIHETGREAFAREMAENRARTLKP